MPWALITTGILAALIAVAAAVSGPLDFAGPRWQPGAAPRPTLPPSIATPTAAPTPTKPPVASGASTANFAWIAIVLGAVILAFIVFFVARFLLARRRERTRAVAGTLQEVTDVVEIDADPSAETGVPYLRRGIRRALGLLDGDRDPSDAIIQAWLGLQESAEDAGFQRQSAETPTEFTTRILRRLEVDAGALATLRRLYLAVRFGEVVATAADVAEARNALEKLQAQWTVAGDSPSVPGDDQ